MAGTVAYMSPEQVRGETLDARSDLFSFGVVLYEMVTGGGTPFSGDTDTEVAEAIVRQAPGRLPSRSPARMARIIGRCLEKDRDQRYGKASDIQAELAAAGHAVGSGPKRRIVISAGAATAAGVLIWLAAAYLFSPRGFKLGDRDSLVIADFVNKTGDSVFDGTLREGLAVQLAQSPFLSVVPDDRIKTRCV